MHDTLIYRPRTSGRFSALMELYEQNYLLVRLLVPELRSLKCGPYVSSPEGCLPLELSEVEHQRYTSTFNLTYRFSGRQRFAREPDLLVRIYHDARTCEVMSGLISSRRIEQRRTRDLEQGYRLNRFLNRWVGYCLRQGHTFDVRSRADRAEPAEPGVAFSTG